MNTIEVDIKLESISVDVSILATSSPARVSNSDDSYVRIVPSGGELELPDIDNTDSDGSSVVLPAQIPMVCTPNGVANFVADNLTPNTEDVVTFTDQSTGFVPDNWFWDFGDGSTSDLQNPTHIFEDAGTFTVKFIAANESGEGDVEIKVDYITVIAGFEVTKSFQFNGVDKFFSADSVIPEISTSQGAISLATYKSMM